MGEIMETLNITPELWTVILSNAFALFLSHIKQAERMARLEAEMRIVLQSIGRARRAEDNIEP